MSPENESREHLEEARALSRELLLIDTHIDLPFRLGNELIDLSLRSDEGHFDAPRAREGGLDAAFMAVFVPAELEGEPRARSLADHQIELVERIAATWPDLFVQARSPEEIRAAQTASKIALPLGMENSAPLEKLEDVEHYARRGIAYVTLAHGGNNRVCDSSFADDRRWNGLSPYGRDLVAEMNRLGVMVDISHVSDETFDQVLEHSRTPVVATHSSCRHFTPGFERNLDDDRIRRLAEKGGVTQINFGSIFLSSNAHHTFLRTWKEAKAFLAGNGGDWTDPAFKRWRKQHTHDNPVPEVPLTVLADHIEHAVEIAGIQHVGFGSDFDGVDDLPVGMEDVSCYPNLLAELLSRGFGDGDLRLLAGENLLRVWAEIREGSQVALA